MLEEANRSHWGRLCSQVQIHLLAAAWFMLLAHPLDGANVWVLNCYGASVSKMKRVLAVPGCEFAVLSGR